MKRLFYRQVFFFNLFVLLQISASAQVRADIVEKPEAGLDEIQFSLLLESLVAEPSVLSQDKYRLRNLTSEQWQLSITQMGLNHHRFLYPVRIKGERLTGLLGKDASRLSLMAVWDGRLVPIPYQFDEHDSHMGYVHIPGVTPYSIDGRANYLDGRDELVFMYRDAGMQRYNSESMLLTSGKVSQELIFQDKALGQRYAYVVLDSSERSASRYVNTDVNGTNIETSFYRIATARNNFLQVKDFHSYLGDNQEAPVIDLLYFKITTYMFRKQLRMSLNSQEHIQVKILGVKEGPVKHTLFLKTIVRIASIPLFNLFFEVHVYEQGLLIPNRFKLSKGGWWMRFFDELAILFYIDMHGLQGGKISADAFVDERGNQLYGYIDGYMDETEKLMNNKESPGKWIWLDTGFGWDVFLSLSLLEEKPKNVQTNLYYLDKHDALQDSETFAGARPRIGMRINANLEDIKQLNMEYTFWYPVDLGSSDPRVFYKNLTDLPQLQVRALSAP